MFSVPDTCFFFVVPCPTCHRGRSISDACFSRCHIKCVKPTSRQLLQHRPRTCSNIESCLDYMQGLMSWQPFVALRSCCTVVPAVYLPLQARQRPGDGGPMRLVARRKGGRRRRRRRRKSFPAEESAKAALHGRGDKPAGGGGLPAHGEGQQGAGWDGAMEDPVSHADPLLAARRYQSGHMHRIEYRSWSTPAICCPGLLCRLDLY